MNGMEWNDMAWIGMRRGEEKRKREAPLDSRF